MNRLRMLAACVVLVAIWGVQTPKASAAVSLSLRIGDPYPGPRLVFVDQPRVAFIPGTRVYYVQGHDLYRSGRYWYYYYDGGWYRGYDYDGPFYFISYQSVPMAIRVVPAKYRHHWRSYRGPAYTYYTGGRWHRSKASAERYQRSNAGRGSSRAYRPTSSQPKQGKDAERYQKSKGGGPQGKGRSSGRGNAKGKGKKGGGQGT